MAANVKKMAGKVNAEAAQIHQIGGRLALLREAGSPAFCWRSDQLAVGSCPLLRWTRADLQGDPTAGDEDDRCDRYLKPPT